MDIPNDHSKENDEMKTSAFGGIITTLNSLESSQQRQDFEKPAATSRDAVRNMDKSLMLRTYEFLHTSTLFDVILHVAKTEG
jgi:hypothetical protein